MNLFHSSFAKLSQLVAACHMNSLTFVNCALCGEVLHFPPIIAHITVSMDDLYLIR